MRRSYIEEMLDALVPSNGPLTSCVRTPLPPLVTRRPLKVLRYAIGSQAPVVDLGHTAVVFECFDGRATRAQFWAWRPAVNDRREAESRALATTR